MRLWVDFNSVEDDGIIRSPLAYAHFFNWNDLKKGAVAELFDGEGQEARGEVVSVNRRNRIVRLKLDLSYRKSEVGGMTNPTDREEGTVEQKQSKSLAEVFPREQERVRELLGFYKGIGPAGTFGAMMIEDALRRADRAAAEQDVVAMLQSYKELQELE